ncbi:uncharacterized protein LOC144364509, partial [Saccoglossus kowalevskii]
MDFPERVIDDKKEPFQEDKKFIEKINKTIKHSDGHYEINLPFRDDTVRLPNNESQAMQRLKAIEKKMQRNPKFHMDYKTYMNDLIHKEHAVKIPEEQLYKDGGKIWYIPHHGVYHSKKPDKIRIVIDCSAKYQGVSLNDYLLQGPDLTNNLLGVLLKFRQEDIAVMSDIEAMFHQVRVPQEDSDCLSFYWWPNGDLEKPPE